MKYQPPTIAESRFFAKSNLFDQDLKSPKVQFGEVDLRFVWIPFKFHRSASLRFFFLVEGRVIRRWDYMESRFVLPNTRHNSSRTHVYIIAFARISNKLSSINFSQVMSGRCFDIESFNLPYLPRLPIAFEIDTVNGIVAKNKPADAIANIDSSPVYPNTWHQRLPEVVM